MKKITVLLLFILILSPVLQACSFIAPAPTTTQATIPITEPTQPPTTEAPTAPPPEIQANAAIVFDIKNRKIVYKYNDTIRIAPASITKLLTACLALEHLTTDTGITVGTELSLLQPNSSLCLLAQGHRLTLLDMLYGLLIQSGNDAAYTIAVTVARKASGDDTLSDTQAVAYFTQMMNDFALEIGMKDSHFTSPDGYDTSEQYVTAADILVLAMQVKRYPILNTIMATVERNAVFLTGETIVWKNTNLFLLPDSIYYNPNVYGMKTGTTANAGTCLLTSYNDGNDDLIVFVAGCATDESRYEQTKLLLSWATQ